jgi:hypothetical protein
MPECQDRSLTLAVLIRRSAGFPWVIESSKARLTSFAGAFKSVYKKPFPSRARKEAV